MPDEQHDLRPSARAPARLVHLRLPHPPQMPRHAVPSLYAPSPRESVVAASLAVALIAALVLVVTHSGGAADAARNAAPAPAALFSSSAATAELDGPAAARLASESMSESTSAASSGSTTSSSVALSAGGTGAASSLAASGIPSTALAAYKQAAARQDQLTPGCKISWPLLAGIGRVESNHGRFAGAVLHTDGLSSPPVVGIPLDGHGTAVIRDTDRGRFDGDTSYDRAVGPMQFIPSTWASWGVDADHDGAKNPFDIFDAAAAAAGYLCAAGRDLATYQGQVAAILSYNHSMAYVQLVMGVERVYARTDRSVPVVPTAPGPGDSGPIRPPALPPVDPGTPRGVPSSPTSSHSTTARHRSSTATSSPRSSTSSSPTTSSTSSCPPTSGTSTSTAPSSTTSSRTTTSSMPTSTCRPTTAPSSTRSSTSSGSTARRNAQRVTADSADQGGTPAKDAASGGTSSGASGS